MKKSDFPAWFRKGAPVLLSRRSGFHVSSPRTATPATISQVTPAGYAYVAGRQHGFKLSADAGSAAEKYRRQFSGVCIMFPDNADARAFLADELAFAAKRDAQHRNRAAEAERMRRPASAVMAGITRDQALALVEKEGGYVDAADALSFRLAESEPGAWIRERELVDALRELIEGAGE